MVYSFDFASSTVILSRQLTIAISQIFNTRHAVPTRLDDINTYPVQLPVLILLESRYPSRDGDGFLLYFLRWEVILFFAFNSLRLIFSFSNLIFWCLFPLASLTDIYLYSCNWCLRESIYVVMRMPYGAMRRRDLRVYVFCMPMPAFGKGFGG